MVSRVSAVRPATHPSAVGGQASRSPPGRPGPDTPLGTRYYSAGGTGRRAKKIMDTRPTATASTRRIAPLAPTLCWLAELARAAGPAVIATRTRSWYSVEPTTGQEASGGVGCCHILVLVKGWPSLSSGCP